MEPNAPPAPPPPPSRRRIGDLAVETVVIVLSVLLALAVDDWRQKRDDQQLVENVLAAVRSEVLANRTAVEAALPHHTDLVQQLRSGGLRVAAIHIGAGSAVQLDQARSVRAHLLRTLLQQGAPISGDDLGVARIRDGLYQVRLRDKPYQGRIEGDSLVIYGEAGIQLKPPAIQNVSWETAQATRATVHMDLQVVAALSEIYRLHQRHAATASQIVSMLYRGEGSVLPALEDLTGFERTLLEKYDALLGLIGEPSQAAPSTPAGRDD